MTKRNITLKCSQLLSVAAYAMMGAANASPVNTAAGTASTTRDERGIPNAVITRMNATAIVVRRTAIHASSPSTMSPTRMGVAEIAS